VRRDDELADAATEPPRELATDPTLAAKPKPKPDLSTDATLQAAPPPPPNLATDATLQPAPPDLGTDRTLAVSPDHSSDPTLAPSPTATPASTLGPAYLPTIELSNYAWGEEIARGGMGRIVEATDRRLRRIVAVKELLHGGGAGAARFEREALISARLQHPAIVAIYEAGRWPTGEPFYAMKRVFGRSLDKVVADAKTLRARLALIPSVLAVFDALAFAHSKRVIHRDLKPANVLVGEFGETVVIDWGLAKDLSAADESEAPASLPATTSSDETMAGAVMGTPAYMPVEQARGETVDERADVYSLGALLYHVLTGSPPYVARTADAVLAAVLAGPPAPIRDTAPGIPDDLATIVETAMARDREGRYATAEPLAGELRRYQTGQLVASHEYSWRQLVARWARRHRGALAVATAALVVVGVVAIVLLRQVLRERAAAKRGLAAALVEKAQHAMEAQRWDEAAVLYARARLESEADHPDAAWRAGLAASRVVPAIGTANAPDHLGALAATGDARTVFAGLQDGRVVARDVDGAAWRDVVKLDAAVTALAVAADGGLAIAGDRAGAVIVVERNAIRTRAATGSAVLSIAIAPGGAAFATGHEDGIVRTWRVGEGTPQSLAGHSQRVYAVRYTPSGQLASSSDDRTIRLWGDTATSWRGEVNSGIKAIAFSRDGATLAAAGWSWFVKLWAVDGDHETPLTQWQTDNIVDAVAYSPDGGWLATAGASHDVVLWDPATGAPLARLAGHQREVIGVAVSRDGARLVSGGVDGVVRWWDTGGVSATAIAMGHRGVVKTIVWRDDRLVTSSYDRTFRVWEMPSGRPAARAWTPHAPAYLFDVARDGTFAVPGEDGTVRVFGVADARERAVIPVGESLTSLSISPDGTWYALGASSGRVYLVDAKTRAIVASVKAHGHVAFHLGWSTAAGAATLVTSGLDGKLRVWSVPQLASLWERDVESENQVGRVSPDGKLFAIAGDDTTIEVTDLGARRTARVLHGHTARVWDLAFSPDSGTLASTSEDGTVRLWRLATGDPLAALTSDEVRVSPQGVAFSGDATRLAVGYVDGTIVIYDVARGRATATLGRPTSCDAPQGDELARACRDAPDAYRTYIEQRTAIRGDGVELVR
jgi:WD40 repeat protein